MTNGTHQIGWLVTDSCRRAAGVGSRLFNVPNTGGDPQSVAAAVASVGDTSWEAAAVMVDGGDPDWVWADEDGIRPVAVAQGQRIEVQLPRWDGVTFSG